MITDKQSYSIVLRDVLFAKTVTLPFFAGFKARRCKMLKVEPEHLPYLGLYLVDEQMQPDGDANAGHIRFTHTLKLGFSVIIKNNDPVAAELKLDEAFWAIMNGLWRDQYMTNMIDTWNPTIGAGNPDNVRFEGVTRGTRRHHWGSTGLNNEIPIAELQYEASLVYRAEYAPVITDDLLRIHVETVPMASDGTVPAADEVMRIIREYEFTPATTQEAVHGTDTREIGKAATTRSTASEAYSPTPPWAARESPTEE